VTFVQVRALRYAYMSIGFLAFLLAAAGQNHFGAGVRKSNRSAATRRALVSTSPVR